MTSPALDAAAAAWVTATDQAVIAAHAAQQAEWLAGAPAYLRDVFDPEDEALDPDESWQTPYGPALPAGVPVMLTDVDGVLSPFGDPIENGLADPDDPDKWPVWEPHQIPVQDRMVSAPLAPAMGQALGDLNTQIMFLTTWNDLANTHISPLLGWEPQPVLNERAGHTFTSERGGWAKLHVVKRWLRTYGPRPLIWVDDHHGLEDLAANDPYVQALPHTLLITIDREVGLTPAHVAQIKAFLDGLPTP